MATAAPTVASSSASTAAAAATAAAPVDLSNTLARYTLEHLLAAPKGRVDYVSDQAVLLHVVWTAPDRATAERLLQLLQCCAEATQHCTPTTPTYFFRAAAAAAAAAEAEQQVSGHSPPQPSLPLDQLQSVLQNSALSHSARVAVIRNVTASVSAAAFANAFVEALVRSVPNEDSILASMGQAKREAAGESYAQQSNSAEPPASTGAEQPASLQPPTSAAGVSGSNSGAGALMRVRKRNPLLAGGASGVDSLGATLAPATGLNSASAPPSPSNDAVADGRERARRGPRSMQRGKQGAQNASGDGVAASASSTSALSSSVSPPVSQSQSQNRRGQQQGGRQKSDSSNVAASASADSSSPSASAPPAISQQQQQQRGGNRRGGGGGDDATADGPKKRQTRGGKNRRKDRADGSASADQGAAASEAPAAPVAVAVAQ